MNTTMQENMYAGLEELDDEGQERVSRLGVLDERADEPALMAKELPALDELKLDQPPPRLA